MNMNKCMCHVHVHVIPHDDHLLIIGSHAHDSHDQNLTKSQKTWRADRRLKGTRIGSEYRPPALPGAG